VRERGEWPLCARVLPPAPWRGRGLLSALAFLFSLLASVVWVCGGCRARRSHVRPGSAARGDGRPDHGVGIQRWFHQTPTANGTASFPWHIAPREGGSHPALSSSVPTEEKTTEQPLCICFTLFRPCRRPTIARVAAL
jgi:hypothetical protein